MNDSYPCDCCGFLTMSESTHDTYEICPICRWENDYVQYNNPNFTGGANEPSLEEARKNFKEFGASSKNRLKNARPPLEEEIPKHG